MLSGVSGGGTLNDSNGQENGFRSGIDCISRWHGGWKKQHSLGSEGKDCCQWWASAMSRTVEGTKWGRWRLIERRTGLDTPPRSQNKVAVESRCDPCPTGFAPWCSSAC